MYRKHQAKIRLALDEITQLTQMRAHRFTKVFMTMGGKKHETPASHPLLQQFHGFAGAFRRQGLTQGIHGSVAHHMNQIRRAAFVQEGATISLGDNKVMTCAPTNVLALLLLCELAQRISCVRYCVQMSHGNAKVTSS